MSTIICVREGCRHDKDGICNNECLDAKTLSEIVEDCKLNKEVDYQDLKYALLVYVAMMNMATSTIYDLKTNIPETLLNMKKENIHKMYNTALNKSPKEYLGWNNDPENPEYQKFHSIASKLVEKAIKGELKPKE